MKKIPEDARMIARWCDDSIPVTDFNFREEILFEHEGLFYLYVYGDFVPTPLNGWVQSENIERVNADRAIEWVNEAFSGTRAAELVAEVENIRSGRV